jgi:D-alanine-D-alanine ligase
VRRRNPTIAVVHTRESPCRCHAAFLRGLRALGLRGVEVCVEELAAAREAIATADLVLEHAETLLGRGDLRPLVRHTIEAWGGRLVGSTAAAAHAADDKIEARRRLEAAGLRVPRAAVAGSPREARRAALELGLPVMLKRPFEHGSRGVRRCDTAREVEAAARRWLEAGDLELLVEEFVAGRELAAAVVEVDGRPRALPTVEVHLRPGATYSARIKWAAGPLPIAAARLHRGERRAVEAAALRAFRALRLRDYARFDLRLPPDGRPCFLEANARPSVEPGTELRLAAALAGWSFPGLLAAILASAWRRHGLMSRRASR